MKLKVEFLGSLYYSVTNNNVTSAFDKPALSEAVIRLIENGKVPGIYVASVLAYIITTWLVHICVCFKGYKQSGRSPETFWWY